MFAVTRLLDRKICVKFLTSFRMMLKCNDGSIDFCVVVMDLYMVLFLCGDNCIDVSLWIV